ncbi:MAG: MYXO-CTERM domain-containing protein, partial [Myxococcota bacterium]
GCVFTSIGGACDDGDGCTTNDTCAGGTCAGAPAVCSDGNPCTTDTCDPLFGCISVADGAGCEDGNPCTDDNCTPSSGCTNTHNQANCNDGDSCTTSDTCVAGVCASTAMDCDDNNPCTEDACDGALGCINTDMVDGADCGAGVCDGGECIGGCGHSCGDVPEHGVCDGDSLVICTEGEVNTVDCAALNRVCGWEDEALSGTGAFDCIPPEEVACAGVADTGSCDGDVLTLCANGLDIDVNCETLGQECQWNGTAYGCGTPDACVPLCSGSDCGDDGCGGDCGTCEGDSQCAANGECVFCGTCENPQHPCDDVPEQGLCAGDTLHKCVGDTIVETSCVALNRVCGWESEALGGTGAFDCVPPEDPQTCAGVPETGFCDGTTLTSCVAGATVAKDCSLSGSACVWTGEAFECVAPAACVPSCSGKDCGDDGCGGTCDECDGGYGCAPNGECVVCGECAVDADCDDGNDCTADSCMVGGVCEYAPITDGTECSFPSACGGGECVAGTCEAQGETAQTLGDNCGSVSAGGACDGHTLQTCVAGEIVETDCLSLGRACGWDETDNNNIGAFDCVTQDEICSGVPDSGHCNGSVLTWCNTDTGQVVIEDCASFDELCQWEGSFHCCHPPGQCVPNCSGRTCGDDGCGGSCGTCPAGEVCSDSGNCYGCPEVIADPSQEPPAADSDQPGQAGEPQQDPAHPENPQSDSGCSSTPAQSSPVGAALALCLLALLAVRRRFVS